MKNKSLYVITGGAGFIGSCLVRHLNDSGISNLILVDDLGESEKWKNLLGKEYIDILDKRQLFEWLKGRESDISGIVHLGACTKTIERDASYLLENNYRYTLQLAQYAIKNNMRFIYASSAATYGDGSLGFVDNHEELHKLRPLNMYGMSKQMFDLWARREGILDRIVGLKFFNVFGPNELHKGRMASAIVHMLPTILKEGVVRLFQSSEPGKFCDGGQMRDFVYVKDVVRMISSFLLENKACGIYNIASGTPHTWNDLARAIFLAVNQPMKVEYVPMPADLVGKYQNYTCADMKKTEKVLGCKVKCMPLNEAVQDYVSNYLLSEKIW